jgi:hypothetical protein
LPGGDVVIATGRQVSLGGLLRGCAVPGFLLAIAAATSTAAFALSDTDILGNWCGSESNYSFSRKVMIVTRMSDTTKLVFDITGIEAREGTIAVSWQRADGKVVRTEFAEFSGDRKTMTQLSNSGGPRREFKRC